MEAKSCGIVAAPLLSVESAAYDHLGNKKKIVSGMHMDVDCDIKEQILWPHKALDGNCVKKHPEYHDLTPVQLAFGTFASVLYQLPAYLSGTPTANMLHHFNRIFTYAESYSWTQVLALHQKFLATLEQREKSWANWDSIERWHKKNLELCMLPVRTARRRQKTRRR